MPRGQRHVDAVVFVLVVAALTAGCDGEKPRPAPQEQPTTPPPNTTPRRHLQDGAGERLLDYGPPYTPPSKTVRELVREARCSTRPLVGLSNQIANEINCLEPGLFVRIDDIDNVELAPAALPWLQADAAVALRQAAANKPDQVIALNSTWRSVAQQHVLRRWEGRCGIRMAATPGRSRHESGRAIDVTADTTTAFRKELTAAGWDWYCDKNNRGRWARCGDPPHWEYLEEGADLRELAVRAFVRLWNRANPDDRLEETGLYDDQIAKRIDASPIDGFAEGPTCW